MKKKKLKKSPEPQWKLYGNGVYYPINQKPERHAIQGGMGRGK